jgi:hypothetical protein
MRHPTFAYRIVGADVRTIGWFILAIVGVLVVVNAGFMLASPRAWFRLPEWIRAQGTLTEEKYTRGWHAIEVRVARAMMLGGIGWVLYDFLLKK